MPKWKNEMETSPAEQIAQTMGFVAGMPVANADMRLRSVLRMMAWHRAQGELRALLATYWSSQGYDEGTDFEKVNALIGQFIRDVEEVLA
jgi:hypothetical protein